MSEPEAREPRTLSPFKMIKRGEDTVNEDEVVVFSDFTLSVVPADTPDRVAEAVPEPAPKDGSAQAPVQLPASPQTDELKTSEEIARAAAAELTNQLKDADSDAGPPSPTETS